MKKIALLIIIFFLATNLLNAQFINGKEPKINRNTNLILGFINPNNFSILIRQQVAINLMYATAGEAILPLQHTDCFSRCYILLIL